MKSDHCCQAQAPAPDLAPPTDPEQHLQATIDQQRHEISQHLARVQELTVSLRSVEETVQRQTEALEQYKRSDENNLKAIETLEGNIWEATDCKNQLLAQIRSLEIQCEDVKSKWKAIEDISSTDKEQLSHLQNEVASKAAELENLRTAYNTCSAELLKLQSIKPVSQDQEDTHTDYQSASQDWETTAAPPDAVQQHSAANLFQTQSNAANFFQPLENSAASFFENLGSSNEHSETSSFFGGFQQNTNSECVSSATSFVIPPPPSQSTIGSAQHIADDTSQDQSLPEEVLEAPSAMDHGILDSLQQQLRQRISEFAELSSQLEAVKAELSDKQTEVTSLQAINEENLKSLALQTETNSRISNELESLLSIKNSLEAQLGMESEQRSSLLQQLETLAQDQEKTSTDSDEANVKKEQVEESFQASDQHQATASLEASTTPYFDEFGGQQQGTSSNVSSFFSQSEQDNEKETSTVASYFNTSQDQVQSQQPQLPEDQQRQLPGLEELSQKQMTANLSWYQTELAQYQQACTDWQVWGEEKTREISELNEHLSFQTEAFRIKAAENEKLTKQLQEKDEGEKKNEAQNLLRLKELEVVDLKESVERLESEKHELADEINEMRNTIDDMRNINDNIESYKDDSADLLDTRAKLEELENEKIKVVSELSDLRNEMATVQFSNDKTINDLRKELSDKKDEVVSIREKLGEAENQILDIQRSLAEEKRMQEDIADEYESMQLQVQESGGRVTELLKEIDEMKEQMKSSTAGKVDESALQSQEELLPKVFELTAELEQYKQTCNDWNVYNENKTAEYNLLLESYNQYVEAYNTLKTQCEELSAKVEFQTANEIKSADNSDQLENLKQELEGISGVKELYSKALSDIEDLDRQLVQNNMMAADNEAKLKAEIEFLQAKLKQEVNDSSSLKEETDTQTNHEDKERLLQNKITEYNILQEAYNQYVLSKEAEIQSLKEKVKANEKELVDKTCAVAKMRISSALAAQMKPAAEPVPHSESVAEMSWSEQEEGWGMEQAEASSSQDVILLETEISELRGKIRTVEEERNKMSEDLTAAKLKNGKILVKVKLLQKEVENLKKSSRSGSSEMDDLDRALQDEVKLQADKTQNELKEIKKETDHLKMEKENLSKKLETLLSANEQMIELKEKQDNEVEYLHFKNKELSNKVEGLNWQLSDVEEQRQNEVKELSSQLQILTSQSDEAADSNKLKLEVASLKIKLEESHQECDRLRGDIMVLNQSLVSAQTETATVKSQVIDLQDVIDRLNHDRDEMALIKSGDMAGNEAYDEIVKLNNSLNMEITSLKQYIQSQNMFSSSPIYPVSDNSPDLESLRDQLKNEQSLVLHLEQDLQAKEESMKNIEEELNMLRDLKKKKEEIQSGLDSSRDSTDREVFDVFTDKKLIMENQRLKSDLDNVSRQRRHLSERIQSWETEVNREDIGTMEEDGLRQELRIAIKTLQIRDHK